jgi:hypothetical protein
MVPEATRAAAGGGDGKQVAKVVAALHDRLGRPGSWHAWTRGGFPRGSDTGGDDPKPGHDVTAAWWWAWQV